MGLEKLEIGVRIRKFREEVCKETRQAFAEKCGLSENHLGKLERGEISISIKALDKICSKAGIKADYVLYGEDQDNMDLRKTINNLLEKSSEKELQGIMNFISLMKVFSESE